jgi:serpin B
MEIRKYVIHTAVICLLLFGVIAGKCENDNEDQLENLVEVDIAERSLHEQIFVNAFAIDMYLQTAQGSGNIFFSPFSIISAMAMTYAGADGETAKEMENALHFHRHKSGVHELIRTYSDRFNNIANELGIVEVANRLWPDRDVELLPEFSETMRDFYTAGVEQADFKHDAETYRLAINEWVSDKTHEKIRDILQSGDVNSETILVLVNAIYFNSVWKYQFEKNNTREAPFYASKGKTQTAQMMSITENYRYLRNPELQMIKIPYNIPGFSMLVLLPTENGSFSELENLEQNLNERTLTRWISEMNETKVELKLPRFSMTNRINLSDILVNLGMPSAFSENNANFSQMVKSSNRNNVFISKVIHQSFIEVDEAGTEAAAATAVVMIQRANIEPRVESFIANRPFMFLIMDDETGVILFMGRVVEI